MGKAIEQFAIARGHRIVSIIDADNPDAFDSPEFLSADVAIEFSTPATAFHNYMKALSRGVKVVSGTTGWTERIDEIRRYCDENSGATFFWSSNFSIGVNIFFALNRYLSALMNDFPDYTPAMEEVHHIHKLDHPSGTAISLAGDIIHAVDRLDCWTEESPAPRELLIGHRREGEVPGIHSVTWQSDVDSITITHSARSRQGFARGAVVAAEWVAAQQGFLTMDRLMHRIISNSKLLDIDR